jgi:hypothetical protein
MVVIVSYSIFTAVLSYAIEDSDISKERRGDKVPGAP